MTDTLFFRIADEGFEWVSFNSTGGLAQTGTGSRDELIEKIGEPGFAGESIFVVPGEDVLVTEASVPSRQYRQILQAVPYVVEESLAMDVEDSFFALGERTTTGAVAVAVVRQAVVDEWVSLIADLDLNTTHMIAEHSLVDGSASAGVVVDERRVHVKTKSGCVTGPADQLPLFLNLAPDLGDANLWVQEDNRESISLALSEVQTGELELSVATSNESAFEHLCRGFSGSEINILQGQYKVAETRSGSSNLWRSVAVLLLSAMVLHLASVIGQGWYLSREAALVEARAKSLYADVFPNDRNVRDMKRRWNSHMGKVEVSNEFMGLLSRSTRGLTGAGLTLSNVNFNESRGDLILQVLAARSEALVQYTQQLSDEGIEAEIGTITQEDEGVRGSIKVKGNAS